LQAHKHTVEAHMQSSKSSHQASPILPR
jgi:hypothetical protein